MAEQPITPRAIKAPSYADALIPIITLIILIAGSIALFGLDALDGPLQVGIVITAMITTLIILKNGHSWEAIAECGRGSVSSIVSAVFILLAAGALIGTWNMSGTIPTLVYYGVQWISSDWFYLSVAVICAATALSVGSAWTTAGTIGVALVGIASMAGISPVITAGAVISGAYLGDKCSPLSETTVLDSQLAGADIFTHQRAQVWTSVPAFLIALVVFALLGLSGEGIGPDTVPTSTELSQLNRLFWITPLNLIPVLVLVVMSVMKTPPSLAIMSAALLAGLMGAIFQPEAVLRFIGETEITGPLAYVKGIWLAMATGFSANSGLAEVDRLLSRGGMDSMLLTIWLIIVAVSLGGLLDEFGLLRKLIDPVLERATTTGRLFATLVGTALGLNIVAADQYVALVLPTQLFKVEFQRRGLQPQNLSRAVADAATVTSPLVPWNSCGAYMAAVLGVPTLLYLPYAVFNIASPILTLLYGITGFKIERIEAARPQPQRARAHG